MPTRTIQEKVNAQVIVETLGKKTSKTFKELSTLRAIRSQEEFDRAGELIKVLKTVAKVAKEEQRKITDPLTQALDAVREHFRPFYERVSEAEQQVKTIMTFYLTENKTKIAELEEKVSTGEISNISTFVRKVAKLTTENNSATIRKVWKASIIDEAKIPRKFLQPNVGLIVEHLKKGGAPIPGVVWEQVDSIAI